MKAIQYQVVSGDEESSFIEIRLSKKLIGYYDGSKSDTLSCCVFTPCSLDIDPIEYTDIIRRISTCLGRSPSALVQYASDPPTAEAKPIIETWQKLASLEDVDSSGVRTWAVEDTASTYNLCLRSHPRVLCVFEHTPTESSTLISYCKPLFDVQSLCAVRPPFPELERVVNDIGDIAYYLPGHPFDTHASCVLWTRFQREQIRSMLKKDKSFAEWSGHGSPLQIHDPSEHDRNQDNM